MKGFDAGLEDKTLSPLTDGGPDDSGDDDELTATKVPKCGRRGPANFQRSGNDTESGEVGMEAKRAMADRSRKRKSSELDLKAKEKENDERRREGCLRYWSVGLHSIVDCKASPPTWLHRQSHCS
ncbi:hypothetical protein SLEP1_g23736 [Rubroshorea leprosula]|uniref:Uncharacterized protein n=1 Tax=Rubroshorea leprosula TaxID=152421 RepID=A0AAV5JMH8_9ROSI|nr:hypothetical protein SLEP1_g23736 [Rubroshorea leprosula]